MRSRQGTPLYEVARWTLAAAFGFATLLAVGLALMTAGSSLFPAAAGAGVTLWLVQGAPDQPSRTVTWLVGVGLAGIAFLLLAIVYFAIW